MKRLFTILGLITAVFTACNDAAPDVSDIRVSLQINRFDQDFFGMDTNRVTPALDQLQAKYPTFMPVFMVNVLGADPGWSDDTISLYVRQFIRSYKVVNDSVQRLFKDFAPYEKMTVKALQYLRYYFPEYKAPGQVITYTGPLDGYGDILTDSTFCIGLHHHLGRFSAFYKNDMVQQTYPAYIAAHFEPDMIPVSCMELVTDELLKSKDAEKRLVEEMIFQGKKLYILSRLLPDAKPYQLIGYSEQQLADCYTNEAKIWNLFVQNGLLQSEDKNIIKNYIGKSPKTQELGEGSPGNIGSFVGWQIVNKYMSAHKKMTLPELITKDPEMILQEAKYKP